MENKTQKQPNNNGNDKRGKNYDVFISYRRLSRTDPQHRHTTSLARSIAQQFKLEGYNAFFDCWTDAEEYEHALEKSKYYIILFTRYSFDDNDKKEEGEKDNFKTELDYIKEGVCNSANNKENAIYTNDNQKAHLIKKENVLLINIDGSYTTESIKKYFRDSNNKFLGSPIIELQTNSSFSIKELIYKPAGDGRKRIKKFPRLSYDFTKTITKIAFALCIPIAVALIFFGVQYNRYYNEYRNNYKDLKTSFDNRLKDTTASIERKYVDSIANLNAELDQYKKERIIFAGGRTVQQYINSIWHIDVNNYKPNAHYIHFPSIPAQQLLWDDVNEDSVRKQCPIVLSAAEIDTNNANTSELKSKGRRIAAYLLDNIPLKVQVYNHHDSKKEAKPITSDGLRKLLMEENTTIWTTTKESGTFLEYKKLLDINGVFDLDSLVNNQNGGRHDFDLVQNIKVDDQNTQNIFLLNDHYYYPNPKGYPEKSYSIVKDNSLTATLPLYVYTIAINNQDKKEVELLPQAKKFLNKIGCNTEPIPTPNDIIVPWPKRQ